MEKFFDEGTLSADDISRGLKSVIQQGSFVPVFASSGSNQIGLVPLLNAMLNLLPSPVEAGPYQALNNEKEIEITSSDSGPLVVYVWKTTADPFVGKQTYFRVYSGVVNSDRKSVV